MAEDILTNAASVRPFWHFCYLYLISIQYEQTLSAMSDELVGSHYRNRSRAVILYYVSRMDAVSYPSGSSFDFLSY
jgi:hypothetical protein